MKSLKKAASLLLAFLLILTLAPPARAQRTFYGRTGQVRYWAYAEIMEAYNDSAVNGTETNTYSPNGNVIMAQFTAIMTRVFYLEDVKNYSGLDGVWHAPNYSGAEDIGLFRIFLIILPIWKSPARSWRKSCTTSWRRK